MKQANRVYWEFRRAVLFLMVVMGMSAAASEVAQERVNSKESLRACQAEVESQAGDDERYKFKNRSATRVEADKYEHWINATITSEKGREPVKILCETSRAGQVTVLHLEPGRWRI